jgi:hypothetical protein
LILVQKFCIAISDVVEAGMVVVGVDVVFCIGISDVVEAGMVVVSLVVVGVDVVVKLASVVGNTEYNIHTDNNQSDNNHTSLYHIGDSNTEYNNIAPAITEQYNVVRFEPTAGIQMT